MIDRSNLKPILRPVKKPKATKIPIRKQSPRRAKESRAYAKLREQFLKDHPYCQHWLAERGLSESDVEPGGFVQWNNGFNVKRLEVPRSAEIHHKKGRGKFYLDTTTWMAVRHGHEVYIHRDPYRYEKGYCLPRL